MKIKAEVFREIIDSRSAVLKVVHQHRLRTPQSRLSSDTGETTENVTGHFLINEVGRAVWTAIDFSLWSITTCER